MKYSLRIVYPMKTKHTKYSLRIVYSMKTHEIFFKNSISYED